MDLMKFVEGMPDGKRMLASSRFRRQVLIALDQALDQSGLSQSDLAQKLGLTRSAVSQVFNGDGNLRAGTISDYLFEMGVRAEIILTPIISNEVMKTYQYSQSSSSATSVYSRVDTVFNSVTTTNISIHDGAVVSEVGA